MIDALIVIIDGHREDFFRNILTYNMSVEIFHYFLRRWRRLLCAFEGFLFDGLLRIHLAENNKEVMTLLALDKACRVHERLHMRAWISAFWT